MGCLQSAEDNWRLKVLYCDVVSGITILPHKTILSCNQMIGQVIGAVQIGDGNLIPAHIQTADGTVIQYKPVFHALCSLPPGHIEDRTHQMHKKTTMTDQRHALFKATLSIPMARQQFHPDPLCALLGL